MYHSITFQTILVSIMIYRAIQGIGINPKISNAHCLKKQPKCIQVIN